jgi:hypothetical protein
MRYIPLKDATSQPELNNVININRKQMAKNIENAYKRDGVSLKFFSPKRKVFVDNSQADETLFIIPTYEDKGLGAKLCRKHGSELQEHLNKYGYIMGGNCYASTEPFSFNQTPVVRVNDNGSTIEAVDGAIAGQYLVLYSYLPDDFPVAYLASNNANDLVYRPSFLWLEKNSSYVKLYTPEVMVERLKKGHVSQEPVLKQLDSESQVPFLFQQQ